jgi:hypothetical protein
MATIKKYQKGGPVKKDDFATVMSKSLNSITPGAPGYKPETAKEKAQGAKQVAEMKKKAAAGKPFKMGGKAKSGGSFPDLNKDGKITKADILKGRGVIAKKGAKVKPCMNCGGKMKKK